MSTISLFPTLTSNLILDTEATIKNYKFFHDAMAVTNKDCAQKTELILEDKSVNNEFLIQDINNVWDVNYDNLYIEAELTISDPQKLFGPEGVAPLSSSLGVGIRWYSRESKQRGISKSTIIRSNQKNVVENIKLKFDRKRLRETLNLEVILYIENCSNDNLTSEKHLANSPGIVLGVIDSAKLILEGESSTFPIQTIKNGNGPLWDLNIGWNDLHDSFNDTVWLRINEEHKDYKYLEVKNSMFNKQLLEEIMISTVTLLIQTAKETGDFNRIFQEESFHSGSVGFLIKYYIEIYEINHDTPLNIYSSVNKGVRK